MLERHNSLLVLTQITFVQPASSSQISNTMAQLFFHSYDDTELEQALSIYERPEGFFQIIGNIGEPITIGPGGDLEAMFENVQIVKASKGAFFGSSQSESAKQH
jgi:hypothetical protein